MTTSLGTIDLIKRLRATFIGLGLKEAKDIVESAGVDAASLLIRHVEALNAQIKSVRSVEDHLRDKFAGDFMNAYISAGYRNPKIREGDDPETLTLAKAVSRDSYVMADAMLAARTKE